MNLLNEEELAWSAVVANTNMNRGRNATGINSYEKDIAFNPVKFLLSHIETFGNVSWLDLCCGEGRALTQTALLLTENNLHSTATLTGIDLIDYFAPIPPGINCLQFVVQPLYLWKPESQYDLITCVHGLHYTGDKLGLLQKCVGSLSESGFFIANLDIKSIYINNKMAKRYLANIFTSNGIRYSTGRRIIQCSGPRKLDFDVNFLGASDKAGANYTGQEAVDAYYAFTQQH